MVFRECSRSLFLLTSFLALKLSDGFNVDTSFHLVIKNSADGPNSFFGSSLVLLKDGGPGLIIGSPRSNSSLASHTGINEPGVVWKCDFQSNTLSCGVLDIDPTGNREIESEVIDRKDTGWLGGSMVDTGNDFLTCASRWQNQYWNMKTPDAFLWSEYFMNGICYSSSQLFGNQSVVTTRRILPLTQIGSSSTHQVPHVWGLGQGGFSMHSSPRSRNEVLLGAPGIQSWRGGIVQLIKDSSSSGSGWNRKFVFNNTGSKLGLKQDSYFGYSLSSGTFLKNKPGIQYVGGAPRGKVLKGHVVIFQTPPAEQEGKDIEILQEFEGTQIGSYFGSSVCVADLNNDGWDDLLVGAPLQRTDYRTPRVMEGAGKENRGRLLTGHGDEGAVFIYLSNRGTEFDRIPLRIDGHAPWSHFGSSLANLGDINSDRYADIAIGAPYANDGSGAVYIYYGSGSGGGLNRDKFQTIPAKKLHSGLKGFGHSLSLATDFDGNGYNDLGVGVYDSGHVVLLRTRPIVTIVGSVKANVTKVAFDSTQFEVSSCLKYSGSFAPKKLQVTVNVTIDGLSVPRRVFLDGASEVSYVAELLENTESCKKFNAEVRRPLETTGKSIDIRMTSVRIVGEEETKGRVSPTLYEITRFGGRVSTKVASGPGLSAFCKECPMIDSDASKLTELVLPLAVPCGDDDMCFSDLRLEAEFKEISTGQPFILGSSPVLTMTVTISNRQEAAIAPVLTVLWSYKHAGIYAPMKMLKKTPSSCGSPSHNESWAEMRCPLGRTLDPGDEIQTVLEFDLEDLNAGSVEELLIQASVTTASSLIHEDSTFVGLVVPILSRSDIFMTGSSSKTVFNLETVSPVVNFHHTYEIGLDGHTPIAGASILIQIPTRIQYSPSRSLNFDIVEPEPSISGGQRSFISCSGSRGFRKFRRVPFSRSLAGIEIEGDNADVTTEEPNYYPDYHFPEEEDARNVEGDDLKEEEIVTGGKSMFFGTFKTLDVDCNSTEAGIAVTCMTVRCRISVMAPGNRAVITIPVRVESKGLTTLFKKTNYGVVSYESTGSAEILGVSKDEDVQPSPNKPDSGEAVHRIEEEFGKVPLWIYIVGTLLGIIILAVLIYGFYRCGLFKRNKPPTAEGTVEETIHLQSTAGNDYAEKP